MLEHLASLRGSAASQANSLNNVFQRFNCIQEQLDIVLDTLKNKCPHNKDEGGAGTGAPPKAPGKKRDDGSDGDDDEGKKKDVQSYTGNTGRLSIDTPNVTFNAFSSGNNMGKVSVVDGDAKELTNEEVEAVLTQHSDTSDGEAEEKVCVQCHHRVPIPGIFKCADCKQHLHEGCGVGPCTGPSGMCSKCCCVRLATADAVDAAE